MNDPPRLRDQSNNPLISEMLSAAGREEPARRAVQSTLLAAATAATVVGSQATAGAAIASTTALSLSKLAVKWTLLSAVVVGGGVVGVESSGVLDDRSVAAVTASHAVGRVAGEGRVAGGARGAGDQTLPRQQPIPAQVPVEGVAAFPNAASPNAASPNAASPNAASPNVVASKATPRPLPASGQPPQHTPPVTQIRPEQLEREVVLLDQARSALSQERYADASRISDRYLAAYPDGTLEQEARFMKMQAARQLGEEARARAEARALIELNPNGPHAKAARELYSASE